MTVSIRCPNPTCGKPLSLRDGSHSTAIRCPGCGQVFRIPVPAEAETRSLSPDAAATRTLPPAKPLEPSPVATLDLPLGDTETPSRIGTPSDAAVARSLPSEDVAPPQVSPKPTTDLPQRIGRYMIRRFLGEGAFGRVYEACDPQLDRTVALKVAKPELMQSEQRIKRFLREGKAAANLRHPHIVPVFDSGSDGGHYYIASAFIPGRSFDKHLAEMPQGQVQDFRRSAQLVRRLAEALAYAHQRKVVHRDVKPANIMQDETGEPLLMDFGLAAREEGGEKLTQEGAKGMGTPAYMAPEQGAGEAVSASDQYSLGCTLYELLTGQTPFAGPPELQMFLHQSQEPPRPRKVNRQVPLDLDTICLKCLEKEPSRRYADCQALADDLRRWLDGEPITARRLGVVERLSKWARRSPMVASLTAALAAVLLLGLIGMVIALVQISTALGEKNTALGKEQEANGIAAGRLKQVEKANEDLKTKQYELEGETARGWLLPLALKRGNPVSDVSDTEIDVFYAIAAQRRERLTVRFIEEALKEPRLTHRLGLRSEFAIHAAVGLDLEKRAELEKLLAERLQAPGVTEEARRDMALALADLGDLSPSSTIVVTRLLIQTITETKDQITLKMLTEKVSAGVARMEPKEAAAILTEAMTKTNDPYALQALAAELSAVVVRLEPKEAARFLKDAAVTLDQAMTNTTDPNPMVDVFARQALAKALSMLAAQMEPKEAVDTLTRTMAKDRRRNNFPELAGSIG